MIDMVYMFVTNKYMHNLQMMSNTLYNMLGVSILLTV